MPSYQRRLPHHHPAGQPLFLTWRLQGSLAPHRSFPSGSLSSGKAFLAMDRLLDQARTVSRKSLVSSATRSVMGKMSCTTMIGTPLW